MAKKETKKVEKEEKKGKKVKLIIALIILLAILIYVFFFLAFKVTFKYNNGEEDKIIKVKFLRKIPLEEVNMDITKAGYNFVGYFETYYLNGKQIATIKEDTSKEKFICKEGFKLDDEKIKCVAEREFDFEGSRIYKPRTIEALWSTKPVEKKEAPKETPKKETKKKETPKKETPKVEEKDEGTISLSASKSCIIGGSEVTVTATVNNAKDGTINWSADSCLNVSGSGTSVKVTGSCGGTVTAKLNNGASSSVTLNHEDTLSVTLTDYENKTPYVSEGYYYGVKSIKTNIPAVITGSVLDKSDAARTSASTSAGADGTVNIKTACGQSKTYNLKAVIN